jgi:signal transduction histidine kinase
MVPNWLRERWGVRATAALLAAILVAVALSVAGFALVLLQHRSVRASVEQQVQAHAVAAADRLVAGASPAAAVQAGSNGVAVLQVLDGAGTVLAASPQLAGAPPLRPGQASVPEVVADQPDTLVGDGPLLVVDRQIATASGVRLVVAGGSLVAAERSTAILTELTIIGVPLLAFLAAAATYAITGRALRPVEAIRAQVAALTDRDLSQRVPEPFAHDEVGRLARTMNDMLARLETARAAQRRFVADASHELRSPLATITARLELGQRRGPTDTDVAEMMPEAHRMSRLIDDLLLLARADERGLAPRRNDVDLDELVEAEAARLRDTTAVKVEVHTAPVRVTGDRAQLARLLRNLTNNAARHARSRVSLRLRTERSEAILDVADDGPGIPLLDRRRVFDRFVRLDEGRARETGGAGLGLAIVAEVVAAHQGRVTAAENPGGGALLHVRLPAQFDSPPTGSTSASR